LIIVCNLKQKSILFNPAQKTDVQKYSLPQLAQRFAQLRVLEVGILFRHDATGCLRPHHERIHRSFDVLLFAVRSRFAAKKNTKKQTSAKK
jgi:hypothetical protein